MYGTVQVFNCYNEPMHTLSIGGFTIGGPSRPAVAAWGDVGAATYQPRSVAVRRVRDADARSAAEFSNGDNACRVTWDSFTCEMTVTIPSPFGDGPSRNPVSLEDDLILYVCLNQSILLTTRGLVIETFTNSYAGAP